MFGAHNILFRQLPNSTKKDVHIQTNKLFLNETIKDILIKYRVSSKYKDKSNIDSLEKLQKKLKETNINLYLMITYKQLLKLCIMIFIMQIILKKY